MMKMIVVSLISFLLVSCITPSPYKIKTRTSHDGLLVQKITDTKYKIIFYGNEDTSQERATDFALLGAARQAESQGYHYFTVLRKNSTNSSQKYQYSKKNTKEIRVVDQNGVVSYTNDYNVNYGSSKKRYSVTRPRVYTTVQFIKNNKQDKNIFFVEQVISSMSKKYNLDLNSVE